MTEVPRSELLSQRLRREIFEKGEAWFNDRDDENQARRVVGFDDERRIFQKSTVTGAFRNGPAEYDHLDNPRENYFFGKSHPFSERIQPGETWECAKYGAVSFDRRVTDQLPGWWHSGSSKWSPDRDINAETDWKKIEPVEVGDVWGDGIVELTILHLFTYRGEQYVVFQSSAYAQLLCKTEDEIRSKFEKKKGN